MHESNLKLWKGRLAQDAKEEKLGVGWCSVCGRFARIVKTGWDHNSEYFHYTDCKKCGLQYGG